MPSLRILDDFKGDKHKQADRIQQQLSINKLASSTLTQTFTISAL